MPNWGFTKEMIDTEPFGLGEADLKPGKIFADPVHGDIYLTKLEVDIVNSKPFQRLRRTKQLGMTHLVYPGATHSRFSHSLGAVRTVQQLLDHASEQRLGLHPVDDLFGEWVNEPDVGIHTYLNWQLARATLVARLGALLHDICHLPYGHSIEDDLGLLKSHDNNQERLDLIWSRFPGGLRHKLAGDLEMAVRHVVAPKLAEAKDNGRLRSEYVDEFPFVGDLVGNTICADLVDYLSRDHVYAGLPMALGNRFLSAFFVTPETGNHLNKKHMALSITRQGHERADIASELLKYLRYRYELTERVLTHHAKLRADAMVGILISMWKDLIREDLVKEQGEVSDEEVTRRLERKLLKYGDEGLLEHLRTFRKRKNKNARRIGRRANELLNRKLFEQRGRFSGSQVTAEQLESRRKSDDPDLKVDFRKVVEDAARFAGVPPSKVALWIPPSKMNLKPAQVLVFDGSKVCSFVEYENDRKSARGAGIERAHRELWCARLFTHKTVDEKDSDLILALVGKELEIRWEELERLGRRTFDWPAKLIVEQLIEEIVPQERPSVDEVFKESQASAKSGEQEPEDVETLRANLRSKVNAVRKRQRRVSPDRGPRSAPGARHD